MEIKTVEKMTTGERIRYYRKQKKITPENTLINTGLNKKQLSKIETNRRKISYDEMKQISKNLGIKTTDLTAPTIVNTSIEQMTVGERIRFYRKQQGMTQKDLGKRMNRSDITVSRYENDRNETHLIESINKIAKALNVDACQLFEFYVVDKK